MNYTPQKIIHNKDVTVVFWEDGTKTLVKRAKGTKYDEYTAFCAALAKKVFNTNSELKRKIKVAENTKRIKPKKKISCGENVSKKCQSEFITAQMLSHVPVRSSTAKNSLDHLRKCLDLEDSPRYRIEVDSVESALGCPTEHHFTLYQYY